MRTSSAQGFLATTTGPALLLGLGYPGRAPVDKRVLIWLSLAPSGSRLSPASSGSPEPARRPAGGAAGEAAVLFDPNSSTKNVGHFLRIDIVAQVPSPSLAWRC